VPTGTDDHDVIRFLQLTLLREHPGLGVFTRQTELEQSPRHAGIDTSVLTVTQILCASRKLRAA
jgi:hypothetical protein